MKIFSFKEAIPIILPVIYFKDKYNDINNYSEMNPSLFINENGDVSILVRCVNYKKYKNNHFLLYDNISQSIYYILKGKIIKNNKLDLNNFEYNILDYEYNLPSNISYWKGLEDIRFIDNNIILVNVPELNQNNTGNPSIFKAELINNKIINFTNCKPNLIEKNWMPYIDNKRNKVIYSLNPFLIKSVEDNDLEEINIDDDLKLILKGYHGSTNGIELNLDERLFLIHINKEVSIHRWLIFNIRNKTIILSEEFIFFKNSYIEFSCSLSKFDDRFFISLGVNDNKAFIIETDKKTIFQTFNFNYNKLPTIVSMIYDIRSLESTKIERNHKVEKYLENAKKCILTLPYPLIIFTDLDEIINQVTEERKNNNLQNITYIYKKPFKETYFYKDFSRLKELQDIFHIINGDLQHETPMYIILNNNKFDFIESAIELNPFQSRHFIWMDFGINHVAENVEIIHDWINKVPDKVKQLCINPYCENENPKEYFKLIYHNMAGGLFSGSIENLLKYSNLFKEKTKQIYNDNWYQIDEAVMTIVQRENPELFDLFYGDYQGIITNYLSPIKNIDLILTGSQKLINYNKTQQAFDILNYCSKYFQENPTNTLVYFYLQQNIIVNYYHNNNCFLDNVVDLINVLKSINPVETNLFLQNHIHNINYYENKEKII